MNHKHVMMAVEQCSDACAVTSRFHRLDRYFNYATYQKIRHNPMEWGLKSFILASSINPEPKKVVSIMIMRGRPLRGGSETKETAFDLEMSSLLQSKLKGFSGPEAALLCEKKKPFRDGKY